MRTNHLRRRGALALAGLGLILSSGASASIAEPAGTGALGGGGPLGAAPSAAMRGTTGGDCIPEEARQATLERADRFARGWEKRHGMTIGEALGRPGTRTAAPQAYAYFPMAGNLFGDVFFNNYTDLGAGSSVLDWDCTDWSYDTHRGHDVDLRSFGEQEVGVPIFAALDGIVVGRDDGHFDMNTSFSPAPANYVILDHGSAHRTLYWHMKNGSVAVSLGQEVTAGEQIGLVASSGFSTGPHLHFETQVSEQWIEPFAGACHPGESNWIDQTPVDRTLYVRDAGVTHENLSSHPGLPWELPRDGQLALSDTFCYVWMNIHSMPANSQWQFKFRRPNGTLNPFQPTGNFGNPFYRWSWWWFSWNVTEMHQVTGTWTIEFWLNGELLYELPVEVRQNRTADFNRPPNDLDSISFDPAHPEPGDVLFCRIGHDLVRDDPDFDIVRYRYEWRVNGQVVRDVVSAAHSDAMPAGTAQLAQTVECKVTPSDGDVDGNSAMVSFTFFDPCPGDLNGDNEVDTADLGGLIGAFGTAGPFGDINGDGAVDTADLGILVGAFGTDCD